MFTGIVQGIGTIATTARRGGDLQLRVSCALDLTGVAPGDSIAVDGVCLTVVDQGPDWFAADISRETVSCTTAADWRTGRRVNLEPALRLGQALGGHLVSGHVDGVGRVAERCEDARSVRLMLEGPDALAPFLAPKGAICMDGVSLTVNEVSGSRFGVNLVPHTLEATTMGDYRRGTRVNLEVDMVARYLARLVATRLGAGDNSPRAGEFWTEHGYTEPRLED